MNARYRTFFFLFFLFSSSSFSLPPPLFFTPLFNQGFFSSMRQFVLRLRSKVNVFFFLSRRRNFSYDRSNEKLPSNSKERGGWKICYSSRIEDQLFEREDWSSSNYYHRRGFMIARLAKLFHWIFALSIPIETKTDPSFVTYAFPRDVVTCLTTYLSSCKAKKRKYYDGSFFDPTGIFLWTGMKRMEVVRFLKW